MDKIKRPTAMDNIRLTFTSDQLDLRTVESASFLMRTPQAQSISLAATLEGTPSETSATYVHQFDPTALHETEHGEAQQLGKHSFWGVLTFAGGPKKSKDSYDVRVVEDWEDTTD